jgi:hypothetical protein
MVGVACRDGLFLDVRESVIKLGESFLLVHDC